MYSFNSEITGEMIYTFYFNNYNTFRWFYLENIWVGWNILQ